MDNKPNILSLCPLQSYHELPRCRRSVGRRVGKWRKVGTHERGPVAYRGLAAGHRTDTAEFHEWIVWLGFYLLFQNFELPLYKQLYTRNVWTKRYDGS